MSKKKKNWSREDKGKYIKERFTEEANRAIDKTNPGEVNWDKLHQETAKQVSKELSDDSKKKRLNPDNYGKEK